MEDTNAKDSPPMRVSFLSEEGERIPSRSEDPPRDQLEQEEGEGEEDGEDEAEGLSFDDTDGSEETPNDDDDRRRALCEAIGIEELPVFNVHDRDPETLAEAQAIVNKIKEKYGFVEPDRGNLDDPSINWRTGRKPDYTVANLQWMLGKSKHHEPGSLELVVENMVKTWEMEATHKLLHDWTVVNQYKYTVQANGGKEYSADESSWVGNYNWLLDSANKEFYDNGEETFESSHGRFRYAFPEGFPWEVLEVFSGPPRVAFSWRHWAVFSGEYKGNKGQGQTVTMTGFGMIQLEDMKVTKIEIFYKPDDFFEVLLGKKEVQTLHDNGAAYGEPVVLKMWKGHAGGCPFAHSGDADEEAEDDKKDDS